MRRHHLRLLRLSRPGEGAQLRGRRDTAAEAAGRRLEPSAAANGSRHLFPALPCPGGESAAAESADGLVNRSGLLARRLAELNLLEPRLLLAVVAEGIIVGGAEDPILLGDVPFGPGIASDGVPAAHVADVINRHRPNAARRPSLRAS